MPAVGQCPAGRDRVAAVRGYRGAPAGDAVDVEVYSGGIRQGDGSGEGWSGDARDVVRRGTAGIGGGGEVRNGRTLGKRCGAIGRGRAAGGAVLENRDFGHEVRV